MQKNSQDFSMQEAMRLAKTPAGQQLLALLQQADKRSVNQAMAKAAAGDYEQAKALLGPLLASEEARALLAQLGGSGNG